MLGSGLRGRLTGEDQEHGALLTLWGPLWRVYYDPWTIHFQPTATWTARDRAQEVRRRLVAELDQHGAAPQQVYVESSQGPVVVRTADMVLATVMDEDLPEYFGDLTSPAMQLRVRHAVAEQWQTVLQQELDQGARMRSSAYLVRTLVAGVILFGLFLGVHGMIGRLGRRYKRTPAWSIVLFLWAFYTVNMLWMLPSTQPVAVALVAGVLWPILWFWVVTLCAGLLILALDILILRYIKALLAAQGSLSETRTARRLESLHQVGTVVARILVFLLAAFVFLSPFPVDWAPVATGAGVVGVALSLALQDALRDVSAGISCILEDQFGVGDWIEADGRSGEVVSLTVRSTRLRTVDGLFVSVPNSRLGTVVNHTNEWAKVDFRVVVPYDADADRCLDLVVDEAEQLARDWPDRVTSAPEVFGMDDLGDSGVTLRVLLRTVAGQQWAARRELNRRVKARFDREGVRIAGPRLRLEEDPLRPVGSTAPGSATPGPPPGA